MTLLETLFKDKVPVPEDKSPEFVQNKKYRLCVEDNPNEKIYRGYNCRDACSPACKLSLYLEELTHEEVMEIDLEIHNMLDRHDFKIR